MHRRFAREVFTVSAVNFEQSQGEACDDCAPCCGCEMDWKVEVTTPEYQRMLGMDMALSRVEYAGIFTKVPAQIRPKVWDP